MRRGDDGEDDESETGGDDTRASARAGGDEGVDDAVAGALTDTSIVAAENALEVSESVD